MPILTLPQLIAAKPLDFWPTPLMEGYDDPRETSGFKTRNPSRSDHNGMDIMYPAIDGDPPHRVESGYTTPIDTPIVACSHGYVQARREWIPGTTGANVWVNIFTGPGEDEYTGWRNLYHHLSEVTVKVGARVRPGEVVGYIREPAPSSVPHIHFALSPFNTYEPADPLPLLKAAGLLKMIERVTPQFTRDRALIAWDRAQEVARLEFVRRLG